MNSENISESSEVPQQNTENLREIERVIASAVILSTDGYMLLGRKDPSRGGVYADAWHIPGGGVEKGESLSEAAAREVLQEVSLNIPEEQFTPVPIVGHGAAVKTLESGERVWCRMEFNRFEVRLDKPVAELEHMVRPGDDLVELRWFSGAELAEVRQIPGGKEFFREAGYIK